MRRGLIIAIVAVVLAAIVIPTPCSWEQLTSDRRHAPAILAAYGVAVREGRPSGIPLNAVTYTVLVYPAGRDAVEVVFMPRDLLRRIERTRDAEEIHVVLSHRTGKVLQYEFGE